MRAESMYSKGARLAVLVRLESLVAQMHRGGILHQEAVCEFKNVGSIHSETWLSS